MINMGSHIAVVCVLALVTASAQLVEVSSHEFHFPPEKMKKYQFHCCRRLVMLADQGGSCSRRMRGSLTRFRRKLGRRR